jgi:hypothetical protein
MDLQAWLLDVRDNLESMGPIGYLTLHDNHIAITRSGVDYIVKPIGHYRFRISSNLDGLHKGFRLDGAELDAKTILEYIGA